MSFNVKIMGADQSVTNNNGSAWLDVKQVSTQRSRLYKLSYTVIGATDLYLWVFDTASGSGSSAGPVMTRYCPAGLSDTWDFYSSGSLFQNGIYVAASTAAPASPATTPTAAGNNKVIIKLDIRVG